MLKKLFSSVACLSLLYTLSTPSFATNPLSPTEQSIVAAVKANGNEMITLLEQSAKINSGTMNAEGVRQVGQLFRHELDQLGFKTRWADMPPTMQRAGHLIAQHDGTKGKRLLLLGHLDTVFEKNSKAPLWTRKGNKAWGQGVADMKGGDVIIIGALRALKQTGVLEGTQIAVVMTGDEEFVGTPLETARADLIALAKKSDVTLAFENTLKDKSGHDTATLGRRAIGRFTLNVTSKGGHSATLFGPGGAGAIYEQARILNGFREALQEPDVSVNVGNSLAGTHVSYNKQTSQGTVFGKNNVIPATAMAHGDLRYLTKEQRDRVEKRMRDIVAQHLPGTKADVEVVEIYPPMPPTVGNQKLLDMYSQASSNAGLGTIAAVPPALRGAGDIQFAAPYTDSLDGLGAAGEGYHSDEEYIDLTSLQRATIRAALMIYRLTR